MKKLQLSIALFALPLLMMAQGTFTFGTSANPKGETIQVDSHGFIVNGKHVLPVMGEMHFSRVPREDWRREIRKMKAGGITILSTYVFWIHHEEEQGKWDWSGNKDLHEFIRICGEEDMPVVLRVGPFCHGEVYQGGFPVWLTNKATADPKQWKLRTLAPGFMSATQRLYSNIYAQVSDLLWKHGGPIVGMQIENECRGPWAYYKALKEMAVSIGFDVPFYTRTGWPKLNGNEEFGQMLPLYGDYADGFWDRTLNDMPGDYRKAFIFKDTRLSGVIATETFGTNQDTKMNASDLQYPYLTCELGGGMMPSYHRRINMSGREPLPLAVCKVGSGSNLPGYYMYHGGANYFNPKHSMAEMQASATTAHNDLPYMTYDFQAPLGEMGQLNEEAFHQTRWFHQFLADWGGELSMEDVDSLSDNYARRGHFEFFNDYVRILNEKGTAYVKLNGWKDGNATITTSSVQPFAKALSPENEETIYFITIPGMKPSITVNGKRLTPRLDKPFRHAGHVFCVLSPEKARTAYSIGGKMLFARHGGVLYADGDSVREEYWATLPDFVSATLQKKEGAPREVKMGGAKVAEQPSNADFDNAALYRLDVADFLAKSTNVNVSDLFLSVSYKGDCARVYADGVLVQDNFWNGKPMLVRLSSLEGKKVELRILPLSKDAPIYLQKEQKAVLEAAPAPGLLSLDKVAVMERRTE